MRKRKNINKKNKIIVLIIIGIILLLVGSSVKNIIVLHFEHKELVEQKIELENKKKNLQQELKNVNDLDYIEDQARKQLRMVKPGEKLYIVDKNKTQKDDTKEKDKNNDDNRNN